MPPAAPSFSEGGNMSANHDKHDDKKSPHSVHSYRKLRNKAKPEVKSIKLDLRNRNSRSSVDSDELIEDAYTKDEPMATPKRRRYSWLQNNKKDELVYNRQGTSKSPLIIHRAEKGLDGDSNLSLSEGEEQEDEHQEEQDDMQCLDFSEAETGSSSSDDSESEDEHMPDLLDKKQKKKFFFSESSAEIFRTDLMYRVRNEDYSSEDSDEEAGPGNGYIRLNDRWREEWNYGVQMPLHPKNLLQFPTEPCDIPVTISNSFWKMPEKYIGIQPDSSTSTVPQETESPGGPHNPRTTEYVTSETHQIVALPKLRLYEGDHLDELWIEERNKARDQYPPLCMTEFLNLMDAFEVECYLNIHQLLLQPLHSPTARMDEVDEEAACDICLIRDCEPEDEMVFCDGCNLCVHMACYGLQELPSGEFFCMKCSLCFGATPPCALCPTTGGALKCTKNRDRWAHVSCALYMPEVRFGDVDRRELIQGLEEISEERWMLRCSICDTRQGACIQCSVKGCRVAFHVTCALRSGLEMRYESAGDPDDDAIRFVSLCSRHRTTIDKEQLAEVNEVEQAADIAVTATDDDTTLEGEKFRQLQKFFYLYVELEAVAKKLNIAHILASDVYEYWKLKRSNQGCKPLIRNPHDVIKIEMPTSVPLLALPTSPGGGLRKKSHNRLGLLGQKKRMLPPPPNSMHAQWSQQSGRIIRSLDMARNLATLTLRREKEKQRLAAIEMAISTNIFEQLSSQVPMSNRTVESMNDMVQALLNEADRKALNELARKVQEQLEVELATTATFPRSPAHSPVMSSPVRNERLASPQHSPIKRPAATPKSVNNSDRKKRLSNIGNSIAGPSITSAASHKRSPLKERRVLRGSQNQNDIAEKTGAQASVVSENRPPFPIFKQKMRRPDGTFMPKSPRSPTRDGQQQSTLIVRSPLATANRPRMVSPLIKKAKRRAINILNNPRGPKLRRISSPRRSTRLSSGW